MKLVEPTDPPMDKTSATPERTGQVIRFRGITRHDLPTEDVLDGAKAQDLKVAVVLGYDLEGEEYFASSIADGADVLWLLERLKLRLLTTQIEARGV